MAVTFLKEGDEILISSLEHHSNIVPWQLACSRNKARIKVIPINEHGELDMEEFKLLLNYKTRLVAVNHASNALGTINSIKEIISLAHDAGAFVLIDGAQAAGHLTIDVQSLDCDFYCVSAHKMYGPTGIGFLYGKQNLLDNMPPYHGGGEMIKEVTFEYSTYNDLPYKFEAGTPNIADVIGMHAAIKYIEGIGKEQIVRREFLLLKYATEKIFATSGAKDLWHSKTKSGNYFICSRGFTPF